MIINGKQQAEAIGNIIARMCAPRSELATAEWLKETSAIGELLKFDFTAMPLMQLYRASDRLLKKKDTIEEKIFQRVQNLFHFTPTITLYDLTNTYTEEVREIYTKLRMTPNPGGLQRVTI